MPTKRRNTTKDTAKQIATDLVEQALSAARMGDDIRPGSEAFWRLTMQHFVQVSGLLDQVHNEVQEEKRAHSRTGGAKRFCVVCGGEIIKKFVKGRWPIYCDECKLADRAI